MGYRQYFTDVVTVYHKTINEITKDDEFERVVVNKVMARYVIDRSIDTSGIVNISRTLSVTILPETDPDSKIAIGDYLLIGEGPELSEAYKLKQLRSDYDSLSQIKAIADNRNKPYLKHRRLDCV